MIEQVVLRDHIAAISCGVCGGAAVLDLDYAEDFAGRHRCQFRPHRLRQYRRGASHRREGPVLGRAAHHAARARPQGRRQARRPAEDGGDVRMAHRRIAGRLVIATHNPGKLVEMRDLLAPYGIEATSAGELKLSEPDETGMTFRDNARIKAAGRRPGDRPARLCRRFRPRGRCARRRARHSFGALGRARQGFRRAMARRSRRGCSERGATTPERRKAHFVSALCVAWPDGHVEEFEATRRRHAGLAAARRQGLRLRSDVPARRPRAHIRRNVERRKTRLAAARQRACRTAPAPSSSSRRRALSSADARAFGVYVHWPFCLSKCPYCDFNSHVRRASIDEARFVRAFAAEIAATAARAPGRTVSTIFFGGGTPSLMQPATVGAILDPIARHWTIAPDARSHAGSQSDERRGRALPRLPLSRRQPRVARRPVA